MFCFQCQETAKNTGCTVKGMCGKPEDTANLQDLLIYVLKGIAVYGEKASQLGISNKENGLFVAQGLFTTITNANWDNDRFVELIKEALKRRQALKEKFLAAYKEQQGRDFDEPLPEAATWFSDDIAQFHEKARSVGVLALADKLVEAVKSGAIKRFVVMGGCDGRQKSRQYFTDVAKALPQDAVILTAGCAKYRYNKLNLGDIGGIPRVLDAGQCNDSYSLAVIALKLKEVFELDDINDLPISYDLGWYEQKAVAVLLALLFLGVKGIRLGPTLPAFLSPNVAKVLVEKFDIKPIGDVQADVEAMLAAA